MVHKFEYHFSGFTTPHSPLIDIHIYYDAGKLERLGRKKGERSEGIYIKMSKEEFCDKG